MSSASPVIIFSDLRRSYGEVTALAGLSIEVHSGEIVG